MVLDALGGEAVEGAVTEPLLAPPTAAARGQDEDQGDQDAQTVLG